MIFKSDIIEAINRLETANRVEAINRAEVVNNLNRDLAALSIKVKNLQKEVDGLRGEEVKVNIKPAKRGRGRPRKACVWTDEMTTCLGTQLASDILNKEIDKTKKALTKAKKSANVKDQPRDKSGKFAKK